MGWRDKRQAQRRAQSHAAELTEDRVATPVRWTQEEIAPPQASRFVLHVVLVLCASLLVWAWLGQLDVVATTEGRLVPQTWVKIVQPADAGIVVKILVKEGQTVAAGQTLMQMDANLLDADTRALADQLMFKRLQLRRIDAELRGQPMQKQAQDSAQLFIQTSQQYVANRQAFLDAVAQEQAMQQKTGHDLQAAEAIQSKLTQLVPSYQRSAEAYEKLGRDGFFSALAVDEKKREQLEKEQDLRAQQASVAGMMAMQSASEKKLAQLRSSYLSNLYSERAEADAALRKLQEEQQKIFHRSSLLSLRAPQASIVKDLATHTPGTVVAPGSILMSLVPDSEPLQAEVLIKNEDVGFVHVHDPVQIKLAAYPFQKYGMIAGIVEHIGPDTSEASGAANAAAGSTAPAASGYRALIRLQQQVLRIDGKNLPLTAGMQIVADMHQGRRSVLAYLLSPLQKAWLEAGRER